MWTCSACGRFRWKFRAARKLSAGWRSTLTLGHSRDVTDARVGAFLPSDFQTTQSQWTWLNRVSTPLGLAQAGVERREQRVAGSTAYTVAARRIDAVFVGLDGNVGNHAWQLNARRDRDRKSTRLNSSH